MRALVFVLAATSLALAGCGKKDVTGNTSALDETVSAQDFSTNDTTAIDAATGADANMAADVDINAPLPDSDNEGADNPARSSTRSGSPSKSANDKGNSSSNNNTAAPAPATPPAAPATQPTETNAN
ncbi:hypothetical protein [Sphingomonas alba]|uniref:Lipoprotein n=1 Tax=Sphingomonas alba TaxID=2908208 RepID=A0ABT0RK08_9SPHN|nr:hypothetical protein [Sphingomonas alba]MCL6682925.1 hypothetical protein [Sphingomonas alba]